MANPTADPAVVKVIADAKGLGATLLGDAQTFGETLIAHVSGAASAAIPDASAAALAVFYDFIPEGARGIVQGVVGALASTTFDKLDAAAVTDVQRFAGIALLRLDALLGKK